MDKTIECWVNGKFGMNEFGAGNKTIYCADCYDEKIYNTRATLTIHNYPEQKIELTANNIREAFSTGLDKYNLEAMIIKLGFSE